MSDAVQQRVALVVALLVLASALIGLALTDDEEVVLTVPSPSASTAASSAPSPTSGTPTTQPTAPSVDGVATAKPVATTGPAPALAVAVAPKPGTYTYRETIEGETSDATIEIANRGPGRQSEEQDGARADVLWSKESKLIDKVTFGTPPQAFECDFAPNIAELKFPLAVGKMWNLAGKCSAPPGITVEFTGTSRTTGRTKRTVGGTVVDTWRIQTKATISFSTPQGSSDQAVDSDTYLAPAHGVYVYSVDKMSGTDPTTGERSDETSTKELVSLTPS